MSKNDENTENVKVEETTAVQVVEEKKPKFKLSPKVKTGIKVAVGAVLGTGLFFLGKFVGSRENNTNDTNDCVEDVDYEVVEDSNEE